MWEEAKDCYAVLGADVDLAVDDEGHDELVAVAEAVATRRRLVAVVELVSNIGGVIGVQHAGKVGVRLESPDDAVLRAICGDGGGRAGVLELNGCRTGGGGGDARVGDGEGLERIAIRGVVEDAVEVGGTP